MDMKEFQRRLDEDANVRVAFLKNPCTVMRRHGIHFNEEFAHQIEQQVDAALAKSVDVTILVGIKIKF